MVEAATEKVENAIAAIREGRMVIMVDEEDRENEGDLVFAAEHTTPDLVNFMVKEARGLVCLTLEPHLVDNLKLPMMGDSTKRTPDQSTAFTVSIEAREGVTTGISAADRAHTIQVAINDNTKPDDIVVPGHIFPLKAREGGVLERAGHTEGSVDLAKMAGYKGAGVICEIMNDDGSMARMPDLQQFGKKHNIPIVAISDMIKYRLRRENYVRKVKSNPIKTPYGEFQGTLFENLINNEQYFALSKGSEFGDAIVDIRVHHHRPLVDVFGCPDSSAHRLNYGLKMLKNSQKAVFVHLMPSPNNNLYATDMDWLDSTSTKEAQLPQQSHKIDERMLGTGAQILHLLGVQNMRIHSTSNRNLVGLSGYGLKVAETQVIPLNKDNQI